ncbi:MAG: chorismate synthase [Candidatus Auribacterota bacterium]|nr:chorismate synthase [Candidatus Auribacterota bacterium]
MLRYLTAGESHGRGLLAIMDGFPAGLKIDEEFINAELKARQAGYGRGGRMKIESDRVEIWGGVRGGITMGSPLGILIKNNDYKIEELSPVTAPRPGHADLAGAQKYGHRDIRNVLERASARETAARVALGAITQLFLREFSIMVESWVDTLGGVTISEVNDRERVDNLSQSVLNCPDPEAEKKMIVLIDQVREEGDTLGGVFRVEVSGLPAGLGSYSQGDTRLDSRIAAALMSIPAIKGVEIGSGFENARLSGSEVHDEIICTEDGFCRVTNRAGGIEGGVSNGEKIVIRAAMKPIPTLGKPLRTVDLETGEPADAARERADVCALPAASVVGRAMVALELARAFLEKFGGDSITEIRRNHSAYLKGLIN